MDTSDVDFSWDALRSFLDEQVNNLGLDKDSIQQFENLKLRSYPQINHGSESGSFKDSTVHRQTNQKDMAKLIPAEVVIDSRECEKQKFTKSISDPKTYSKSVKQSFSSATTSPRLLVVDVREQEKDRLAEIFASSSPTYLCEATKNCVKKGYTERNSLLKREIPVISISSSPEDPQTKGILSTSQVENTGMVRIGEYSPLNPNNAGRRPSIGIGEYGEERRTLMVDRRKHEYNEYLKQAQQSPKGRTNIQDRHSGEHRRSIGTQTEWNNETLHTTNNESPTSRWNTSNPLPERERYSRPASFRESPKSIDEAIEKEVKEQLYRDELRKQIDEKNKLKELTKKREEEEEAKMEAKIRMDQEIMKRRYEEERLQRLELAIRKKEQEDVLRQKLAEERDKALEDCKSKRKQLRSRESNDKACQNSPRCNQFSSDLQIPISCESRGLTDIYGRPRLPQSLNLRPPERDLQVQNVGSSLVLPNYLLPCANRVDMLKKNSTNSLSEHYPLQKISQKVAEKSLELKGIPREPTVNQLDKILLPNSPPQQPSPPSPPLPTLKRTNCEILEDKWKVPDTENCDKYPDVFSGHSRSVLTQLGAFRRHLQQERLRMQQRLRDESP